MKRRAGRIGLVLGLLTSILTLAGPMPAANATDITFTWNLNGGTALTAQQKTDWATFKSSLTGSYGSFTFGGTNGSITVSDSAKVQNLANGMRTNTTTTETIGANTWRYYYAGTSQEEFGNQTSWQCGGTTPMYEIRPTIGTGQWGGIQLSGTADSCGPVTQTITLTFTVNAPSSTTFSTTQSTPTNIASSSTISYSLIMSQSVTGLAAADFQFGGTSSCNPPSVTAASGTTFTVTVTNCSEGSLILQMKANSVTGTTTTGPSTIASANTIVIDRTAPTISSTLTGPANATYIPTQSLTFTAPFSETVTVTGTPRLALTIGSTTRYANYASGTNTRTLTFTYVVQTALADIDINGISLATSLEPNSGSIQDLATNTLSNFSFTAPTLTSVLVAQRPGAPTIDSITATSGQLAIAFTAGATNGSAITNYEFSTNNGVNWTTRSPVATTSPLTISSLTNGQTYNVRLRAINGAGFGESSTAVSATPTAVIVAGGSDITTTYGQAASSSAFTATGGTGVYTYSLSATPSGVSISGSTVTASATTPAGTYIQNVIATDNGGSPQSGTKAISITVAKATTSITIALPNAATNAALGGAVTITATVSRAGAVNFRLGGTTLTGCGAAAASSTTATCTWTPASLGSVSLTAIFTPTDTSNFETSTTTTLTITVVNGVSTVTLSLTGGVTQVPKGQAINIIAAIDQVGRITFLIDGKRIPGCFNIFASVIGNRSCSWKPAVQKAVSISARLVPTNNVFNPSVSSLTVQVIRRTGTR